MKIHRKGKRSDPDLHLHLIEEMSHTELAQACREVGHEHAYRHIPRDELEDMLLGRRRDLHDPVQHQREVISAHVLGNLRIINASLLDCDMNCPLCPHSKVIECYTSNKEKVE